MNGRFRRGRLFLNRRRRNVVWLVEVPKNWLLPCVEPDDGLPEDESPVEGDVYGVDAGGSIFSNMA
ncbi:hypothetical protein RMR16_003255 [Agrobacterium sp. rho-13.3]|uniref:hypothetical protein n=1 Tax=Agrobacterium sp. rho-13.3 TaxID=3072980 RepID=UPI002A0EEFE8|nr:hypothetical protein [Agrobacterium sp. rho-13.3]MDX8308826.1 hypothetical protein [Agrobacterium sp. rho-13.3]